MDQFLCSKEMTKDGHSEKNDEVHTMRYKVYKYNEDSYLTNICTP